MTAIPLINHTIFAYKTPDRFFSPATLLLSWVLLALSGSHTAAEDSNPPVIRTQFASFDDATTQIEQAVDRKDILTFLRLVDRADSEGYADRLTAWLVREITKSPIRRSINLSEGLGLIYKPGAIPTEALQAMLESNAHPLLPSIAIDCLMREKTVPLEVVPHIKSMLSSDMYFDAGLKLIEEGGKQNDEAGKVLHEFCRSLLSHEEPFGRQLGATLLGRIGRVADADVLRQQIVNEVSPAARLAAAKALYLVNPDSEDVLPACLEYLFHEEAKLRHDALDLLAEMKTRAKPARPQLVTLFSSDDARIRQFAATAFAKTGTDTSSELTELLEDRSSHVRMAAAYALGEMAESLSEDTRRRATAGLLSSYHASGNDVQAEILSTLGAFGPDARAAVPLLLNVLTDKKNGDHVVIAANAIWLIDERTDLAAPIIAGELRNTDCDDVCDALQIQRLVEMALEAEEAMHQLSRLATDPETTSSLQSMVVERASTFETWTSELKKLIETFAQSDNPQLKLESSLVLIDRDRRSRLQNKTEQSPN